MQMLNFRNVRISTIWIMMLIFLSCQTGQNQQFHTRISIQGEKWYINDQITNPGSPAEGLLMNVRMVNSVFEDRGEGWQHHGDSFDPEKNTQAFIERIPEYVNQGVNAFVISLQGGSPGYEGAINTGFEPDGSLRQEYLDRVDEVIRTADEQGAGIILSCLYQRQRDNDYALESKEAIIHAVENTANWISEQGYTNVVLEVANEYPHGGYRSWPDSEWLISDEGQVELMVRAKTVNPDLLVSTSGLGHGRFPEALVEAADFLIIHFNNTALEDYEARISPLKRYGKPIVCNEDDKVGREGAAALAYAVQNGASWGFMHSRTNQYFPFEFKGREDDPDVYDMYKNLTTPGYTLDTHSLKQPSITITYPNDGNIFQEGENIPVTFSHIFPDTTKKLETVFIANDKEIMLEDRKKLDWTPTTLGDYLLKIEVRDEDGQIYYTSAPVDVQVKPSNSNN